MNKQTITNEDTVHTLFFSSITNSSKGFWETLCTELNSTLKNLSNGYIWHRDEFKVCLPIMNGDNSAIPMHLIATTCFGDNIEDEWFIIYLILELSKKYPNLIIQVTDNDGDFLLIEAANYLPSWANPESTENRVFISNYAIHLIPPDLASLKNKLGIIDALQLIVKCSEQTKVLPEILNAILTRISQYPEKITENMHRVIVYLPLDIAAILTIQPSLIAPIVTTYCNHDIIDYKACRNIEFTDYAYVEVHFTKYLYAMLMHSKLIKSGINKFSAQDKKKDLGLKITHGYQMLMKTLIKDIFSTKEFIKFKNNLKQIGYFRNNIEYSKDYNILLENAKKYFMNTECPISTSFSNNVAKIMASKDFLECRESLNVRNATDKGLTEDRDDWLSIQPNQLNKMLNNRYGNNIKFHNDELLTPETVTSKLADFLKQSSDFEGVDTKNNKNSDDETIDFDANQFEDCLQKMMNLVSGDVNYYSDLDSDSEDDAFDNDLDEELATKLHSYDLKRNDKSKVMFNLTQSIKEEGLSGPSSNLLSSVGINKTDLLDSGDDRESQI